MALRNPPSNKNIPVSKFNCYWTLMKRPYEEPDYPDVLVLAMLNKNEAKRQKEQWSKYLDIEHATTWFSGKNTCYLALESSTAPDKSICILADHFMLDLIGSPEDRPLSGELHSLASVSSEERTKQTAVYINGWIDNANRAATRRGKSTAKAGDVGEEQEIGGRYADEDIQSVGSISEYEDDSEHEQGVASSDDTSAAYLDSLFVDPNEASSSTSGGRGKTDAHIIAMHRQYRKQQATGQVGGRPSKKSRATRVSPAEDARYRKQLEIQKQMEEQGKFNAITVKPLKKPKKKTVQEIEKEEHRARIRRINALSQVSIPDVRQNVQRRNFMVNVFKCVEPRRNRAKRTLDRPFVEVLKDRFKKHPYATVQPLCLVILGVASRDDFDLEKMDDYEYETLGGLHSTETCRQLFMGKDCHEDGSAGPSGLTANDYENFKSREAHLYFDNLDDEDARLLGDFHNTDAELRHSTTFMDLLRECRAVRAMNPDLSDHEWKMMCLRGMGKDRTQLNAMSPTLMTSKWSEANWVLLQQVNDMWTNYQCKGQKPPKRPRSGSNALKMTSLTQSYVTALNGMSEATIANLLQQMINKQKSPAEAAEAAKQEKVNARIRQHWMKLTRCPTEDLLVKRYGSNTLNHSYHTFGNSYKRDKKRAPNELVRMINKHHQAYKVRVESAERSAEAKAEAGEEDGVFKEFSCKRIFLTAAHFRGQNDNIDEDFKDTLNFEYDSRTSLKVYEDDALTLSKFEERKDSFSLVIVDPPYGVTNETWDTAWTNDDLLQCLLAVIAKNLASSFVMCVFCSADQLSGFIKTMHYPIEKKDLGGRVFHAAWFKDGNFQRPARGGGLSYDLEFLVFGIYTAYSEEPEPGQQRALFHYNEGENRSNVFQFLPVKNKRKYTAEDATQVIINPCQKPIRLMRHIIEHFTLANDNVLDLCSGTGSTAIACLLSNRNCVSVEKQEFQGTMIQSRINTFITTYENEDLSEAGGRWDIMEKEF